MIKFENTEVIGWEHTIRGMRNPMNSWEKSDSSYKCPYKQELPEENKHIPLCLEDLKKYYGGCGSCTENMCIGPNDLSLMKKLRTAGTDHRKFMRMIAVYVDITAPLYWWKEFDTYKVGTVANSCSTMHKIHEKEFTLDDFSHEYLTSGFKVKLGNDYNDFVILPGGIETFDNILLALNRFRAAYIETKNKDYWWQMIQLLPSSYNQKRTVMMNYEVLANIYKSRKNHKLDEWSVGFMNWIRSLPYSELITGESGDGKLDKKEVESSV